MKRFWLFALTLLAATSCTTQQVPSTQPETIHILLEAYDMALPRMTSYARFIITVVP